MAKTDEDDQAVEQVGARSFARFVEQVGDGDFLRDVSDAQLELTRDLQDKSLSIGGTTKLKGELTIKLSFSCDARGNVGIETDVKIKKPKVKRPVAQAWVTKHGHIVFEPPRQMKLPLREVARRGIRDDVGEDLRLPKEV